jgi:hypothetical protein
VLQEDKADFCTQDSQIHAVDGPPRPQGCMDIQRTHFVSTLLAARDRGLCHPGACEHELVEAQAWCR